MARSTLLSSALGAAFLAAVCASAPAYALDDGQCGSKAEITAALHDEGQVQVISGQRAAIGLPKNIFTANADLSLGYNVESGVGSEAGKVCIGAKYNNIRFNADPQLARPSWASFGAGTANDQYLADMESKFNEKVLMGATTIVRKPDGSEARGPLLMVLRGETAAGTSFANSGSATATSSRGGINTLLAMANIETSANFATLAKVRVQTASAEPVTYNPR